MSPKSSEDEAVAVKVEGRKLTLTSLSKVMYPQTGFTKAQVVDYYTRIAPAILPHLQGRPLTRVRWPHGTADESFFEKRVPMGAPDWVPTVDVVHKDESIPYVMAQDLPTLVWLANLNALELHPQLHLGAKQDEPTMVVFDLDPGAPAALLESCQVALEVRALLEELGLACWPKVSGGKGLQVYAPLHTPGITYEDTKPFALAVARLLERVDADAVTSHMAKAKRPGKVFIDWSQNDQVKTTVGVYSLRGRERPTVSAPLAWPEVEAAVDEGDASALVFEPADVLARFAEHGDLFAPVAEERQELPKLG